MTKTPEKIFAIDDDTTLLGLLNDFFSQQEYEFISSTNPVTAVADVVRHKPDLIILDVMLPGGQDGFAICEEIRKTITTPIIMLSARGDVHDRIRGLETGADDYLPKPFNPRELLIRAKKLMARAPMTSGASTTALNFEFISIDPEKREVILDGTFVSLSGSEFEVLYLLATHAGEVIHRDQISQAIAGRDWNAFSRSVDAIVSRLRARLGDDARSPRHLSTVWGRGYVFIGKKIAPR